MGLCNSSRTCSASADSVSTTTAAGFALGLGLGSPLAPEPAVLGRPVRSLPLALPGSFFAAASLSNSDEVAMLPWVAATASRGLPGVYLRAAGTNAGATRQHRGVSDLYPFVKSVVPFASKRCPSAQV